MTFDTGNRLIAAIDVPTRARADELVERIGDAAAFIKIGLELFAAEGPGIVRDYVAAGRNVMLDLKLHDIPATVGRATARLADLGASLVTIHASGGRDMMAAAAAAVRTHTGPRMHILAVTVLTSLDAQDLLALGVTDSVEQTVVRRAQLAMEAGCDGVVASPAEAAALRRGAPDDFLIVTPGVRPAGAEAGDQKRIMTPAQARAAGASLIVVGRPIRDAADPREAAQQIAAELNAT